MYSGAFRIAWRSTIVAAFFLAACLGSTAAQEISATISIHTPDGETHIYPATGPLNMTVEQAMQYAKIKYTATWFPSPPGYALMIAETVPSTTTGDFTRPFWWLCVNGVSSQEAFSSKVVVDGDAVDWFYLQDGKCQDD